MKLNWNIHYQIVSKYIYPIDVQIIFEIPIAIGMVYMKQDLIQNSNRFIVLLDTKKFIQTWRTSQNDERFPNYHIGNEQIWCSDRKFHLADTGFKHGINNPVPITDSISCDDNHNIYFRDGFTRTIWLLANHAEYFPIATRHFDVAKNFQQSMGRNKCAIYAVTDIYQQWWQQNQHLFPQVPDDEFEKYLQSKNRKDFDISDFSQ